MAYSNFLSLPSKLTLFKQTERPGISLRKTEGSKDPMSLTNTQLLASLEKKITSSNQTLQKEIKAGNQSLHKKINQKITAGNKKINQKIKACNQKIKAGNKKINQKITAGNKKINQKIKAVEAGNRALGKDLKTMQVKVDTLQKQHQEMSCATNPAEYLSQCFRADHRNTSTGLDDVIVGRDEAKGVGVEHTYTLCILPSEDSRALEMKVTQGWQGKACVAMAELKPTGQKYLLLAVSCSHCVIDEDDSRKIHVPPALKAIAVAVMIDPRRLDKNNPKLSAAGDIAAFVLSKLPPNSSGLVYNLAERRSPHLVIAGGRQQSKAPHVAGVSMSVGVGGTHVVEHLNGSYYFVLASGGEPGNSGTVMLTFQPDVREIAVLGVYSGRETRAWLPGDSKARAAHAAKKPGSDHESDAGPSTGRERGIIAPIDNLVNLTPLNIEKTFSVQRGKRNRGDDEEWVVKVEPTRGNKGTNKA
jgi:hypothetical protein